MPLAAALAQPTFLYVIRTVAGSSPLGDGGPAAAAFLSSPEAVAIDSKGSIYIGSRWSPRIRKVSPSGTVSAFAEVSAWDLAVDRSDNIYASDGDARIYRITASGAVSVFAGTGVPGFHGDDGPATQAQLRCSCSLLPGRTAEVRLPGSTSAGSMATWALPA